MSKTHVRLAAKDLRPDIDPRRLGITSTNDIEAIKGLVGQERALDAIRLASGVGHKGFNLFVLGPAGTGKHHAVTQLLEGEARTRAIPDDWAYVNNFDAAHKPKMLRLSAGTAEDLKKAMEDLVDDLANDIPAFFESEDYQSQRRAIEQEFGERHESEMADFAEKAKAESVALLRTPMGFMLTAVKEGRVLKPEDYEKLSADEQAEIDEKIGRLQEDLAKVLRHGPKLEKEHRNRVEALNASMAERVVSARMQDIETQFAGIETIQSYLETVHGDIIDNAELFLRVAGEQGGGPFPEAIRKFHSEPVFDRYMVNVMVSQEQGAENGAPVVKEDLPTMANLIGRVEHVVHMGALVTNFTMIKPGALHRANGGYLILDARAVLIEPLAWDALKRCLDSGSISITSAEGRLGLASTTSLEPDPIPLNVRVVLVGDRMLHALLTYLDPDFRELFKLQADFEDTIDRSEESTASYLQGIAGLVTHNELRPVEAAGLARLLEQAIRLADDAKKYTLQLDALADILREADHYAGQAGRELVGEEEISKAISEQERRASRVRDQLHEAVMRDIILIDTDGEKVGQVNGLSVYSQGTYQFGRPSRITARVRTGTGKLVDIEREVELGGPLHSKGVMILAGYLTSSYALDAPFSLHASLVFEQSYGGVDGDSASSAELYALLSALSGVPLRQGLAVTGSVNQAGQVQAIGGVNEKIEGFFETCAARGLSGDQGVVIPKANVEHLCLKPEIVEAVEAGKFAVYAVERIDEGIELLTGVPAGERGADGSYPADTINAKVEARLIEYAEQRRSFLRKPGNSSDGETS